MYALDDTIVAISTPIGEGGIGIVRLSGPEALAVATGLFRPHRPGANGIEPGRLHYGHIVAPDTGQVVDEVLLSYMPGPHSYTRQDVVEVNAHGGIVPLGEILSLCLASGARMAREGEFTLRAFLNGRIDLAQAEAVLDIIRAKTQASLRVAVNQLGGRLSQVVREVRSALLEVLAYLEATIDYPEEDVPLRDIGPELEQAAERLTRLSAEAERGIIYRQGIRTAIVGRPNVGKSSLLNTLLRTDRAIVTPIPGTTRDTLEETLNLQGIPLVLVDTAGISESVELVERMGIERSVVSVQRADLVLMVVDGSEPPTAADYRVALLGEDKTVVVVVNKCDLPPASDYAGLLPKAWHVAVSALTGEGIARLEALLVETIFGGQVTLSDEPATGNPRHRDLFRRALAHLCDAQGAASQALSTDLIAIDVSEAVTALGEITGETTSEDLMATIFGSFCIGK